jgi:hypothetical protein
VLADCKFSIGLKVGGRKVKHYEPPLINLHTLQRPENIKSPETVVGIQRGLKARFVFRRIKIKLQKTVFRLIQMHYLTVSYRTIVSYMPQVFLIVQEFYGINIKLPL